MSGDIGDSLVQAISYSPEKFDALVEEVKELEDTCADLEKCLQNDDKKIVELEDEIERAEKDLLNFRTIVKDLSFTMADPLDEKIHTVFNAVSNHVDNLERVIRSMEREIARLERQRYD